jgi:hypothetical protein
MLTSKQHDRWLRLAGHAQRIFTIAGAERLLVGVVEGGGRQAVHVWPVVREEALGSRPRLVPRLPRERAAPLGRRIASRLLQQRLEGHPPVALSQPCERAA